MNPYAAVLSPAAVASAPIPSPGDSIHETKSRYATPTRPPWSHPSRWALRPAANPPAPTASRFRPLSKASGASHAGVKATASPTDTANAREARKVTPRPCRIDPTPKGNLPFPPSALRKRLGTPAPLPCGPSRAHGARPAAYRTLCRPVVAYAL